MRRKPTTITDLIERDLRNPAIRKEVEGKLAVLRIEQMIARLRERAGLTQRQLAERVGRSQPWVAAAETRSAANMQISTLATLVAATGGSLRFTVKDPRGRKVESIELVG